MPISCARVQRARYNEKLVLSRARSFMIGQAMGRREKLHSARQVS
jgi:hypothetical protein